MITVEQIKKVIGLTKEAVEYATLDRARLFSIMQKKMAETVEYTRDTKSFVNSYMNDIDKKTAEIEVLRERINILEQVIKE